MFHRSICLKLVWNRCSKKKRERERKGKRKKIWARVPFANPREKNKRDCWGLARYFSGLLATGSNQLRSWHVNLCFCNARWFEAVTNDFFARGKEGGEEEREGMHLETKLDVRVSGLESRSELLLLFLLLMSFLSSFETNLARSFVRCREARSPRSSRRYIDLRFRSSHPSGVLLVEAVPRFSKLSTFFENSSLGLTTRVQRLRNKWQVRFPRPP